jgi:hypothetical protein
MMMLSLMSTLLLADNDITNANDVNDFNNVNDTYDANADDADNERRRKSSIEKKKLRLDINLDRVE